MRSRRILVLESVFLAVGAAVVLTLSLISPSSAGQGSFFTPAVLGGQPPNAVVLAKEDNKLAVALAFQPGPAKLGLVATILGQDGAGADGLEVSFALTTRDNQISTATAASCTPGCYQATLPATAPPKSVEVTIQGAGAGPNPVRFTLPRTWPPKPALPLVRQAEAAYGRLTSLVTRERLGSDLTHVLYTTYEAVAPNQLQLKTRGGGESIVLGHTRWDKQPGTPWKRSTATPVRAVAPYWTPQVEDATLIGSTTINGRPTSIVSFADPRIPAFFTIWIDDRTHRTLQLRMTAAAHFMTHHYGPFDSKLSIKPPTSAQP
jgi:hypothetical protein